MDFRQFLRQYPAKGSTHQSLTVLWLGRPVLCVRTAPIFKLSDSTTQRLIKTKNLLPSGAWIPDSAIEFMERLERRHNSSSQERILQDAPNEDIFSMDGFTWTWNDWKWTVWHPYGLSETWTVQAAARRERSWVGPELTEKFSGKIEFFKVHENVGNGPFI